jgi:hypothetical protein
MMLETWATIQVIETFIGYFLITVCGLVVAWIIAKDWWRDRKKRRKK